MIQKIYVRSVMKMGREPEHSLMVTIPKKICKSLQIEKGVKLYFKLEDCRFAVSRDSKFLDNADNRNDNITMIESKPTKEEKQEHKKEENEIIVAGVSLADLQY